MRKDLSLAYRAVQGGHAVAQWMIDHPGRWENEYLIYLDVQDVTELNYWLRKLDMRMVDYSTFHEPDLDGELTGIACVSDGKVFRRLKTMGTML